MICTRVAYSNFRNIAFADLRPQSGVNILYGNNAQGKTNALEGIYLMAQGRSFRAAHEKEMIRFGSEGAVIHLEYENVKQKHVLEMRLYRSGKRSCRKDGIPVTKLSEFIGSFRAVIFCPGHLSLVHEGPGVRRAFADMAISQLDAEYLAALQRYNRILGQRNALLRQGQYGVNISQTLPMWSERLAEEAAIIAEKRLLYLEKLDSAVGEIFADMTDQREKPHIVYRDCRKKEEYLHLLQENNEREIKMATTLYGIHRDDFLLLLNGKEARKYASQGQQRSMALAMKLSEGELSKRQTGEYPVYLLDDVFSEIDAERRAYLTAGLTDRQVIITSCESHRGIGTGFFVCNGNYTRQEESSKV